eukprot:CAMPEP_0185723224 /NCGR_PEP_ID=MMETSP1171-20130828/142_1 /TAXON_ID=374046 /ORGANISM="Helicotheca tamensis, Strain CCMP826" /LENGTH=78 /DNA_ID=CAMNT_0028390893 /DNA_START=93 /DNA_END=329 /DNA_ORIENTATION=-
MNATKFRPVVRRVPRLIQNRLVSYSSIESSTNAAKNAPVSKPLFLTVGVATCFWGGAVVNTMGQTGEGVKLPPTYWAA